MTLQERENRFIQECRKNFGTLTFEAEQLLRWGFSRGAEELSHAGFLHGVRAQRGYVLEALGAAPQKYEPLP
jgi:hypothetical protein